MRSLQKSPLMKTQTEVLSHKFGLGIRRNRTHRRLLIHRQTLRLAVNRTRRNKHKLANFLLNTRNQKIQSSRNISIISIIRIANRKRNTRYSRKMNHSPNVTNTFPNEFGVFNVTSDKINPAASQVILNI